MLSNAYFLAKFRFDTAENEPAKNLQKIANFANFAPLTSKAPPGAHVPAAERDALRLVAAVQRQVLGKEAGGRRPLYLPGTSAAAAPATEPLSRAAKCFKSQLVKFCGGENSSKNCFLETNFVTPAELYEDKPARSTFCKCASHIESFSKCSKTSV